MNWENLKEKLLAWGENDYVFADTFMSIMEDFEKVDDAESRKIYTFLMLEELMKEKLIKVFFVNEKILDEFIYYSDNDIKTFISIIDDQWLNLKYDLPLPNQLFWITTNDKGLNFISLK